MFVWIFSNLIWLIKRQIHLFSTLSCNLSSFSKKKTQYSSREENVCVLFQSWGHRQIGKTQLWLFGSAAWAAPRAPPGFTPGAIQLFWEEESLGAMAPCPCSITTARAMKGCWRHRDGGLKGQVLKWFGGNWQRLTYRHPNCLCPENLKYSCSRPNQLVKSALEMFVIKLNVAGENKFKKNFWFIVGSTLSKGGTKSRLACPVKVTEVLSEERLRNLVLQRFGFWDALGHPLNLY